MFDNIGAKIKGLAKFIFWFLAILSVIGGIVIIVSGMSNSRGGSGNVIVSILVGLLTIALGIILSWIQNFLLYGFGELVDSNQKILRELKYQNSSRTSQFGVQNKVTEPINNNSIQ